MTSFVTGATGFIGSRLAEQLVSEGHEVHAIYRKSSVHKLEQVDSAAGLRYFEGDLLDEKSLLRAMQGCNTVYHLAGYARMWAEDPDIFYKINVDGTRNVLRSALESDVQKVVITSTAATLTGAGDGIGIVDENQRSPELNTDYARTKYIAELAALEFCKKGLNCVIVNPTRVYGPGPLTESNALTRLIEQYINGRWRYLPGDGDIIGNYVFIDDVVRGHIYAMNSGKPGERYILGGENITFKKLLELTADISGKKKRLIKIPIGLIRFVAEIEKRKAELFGIDPLLTPAWVEKFTTDIPVSSQKAIDELTYTITSAKDGIEKTIEWLKSSVPIS